MNTREFLARIKTNWKLKLLLSFLLNAAFAVFYLVPQHVTLFTVIEMRPTVFDDAIPFVPVAVFLYESLYILMPIAPWLMETKAELKRYSIGIIVMTLIGFSFFILFPSSCPRPENIPASNFLYNILITLDKDLNAFPSLHAAFSLFHCACCCALFNSKSSEKIIRIGFWIWGLGIVLATLLTKQHFMLDLIAGVVLGIGAYLICFKSNQISFSIAKCFCPGLLETGIIDQNLMVVRDGLVNFYVLKSTEGLVCIDTGWRRKHILHEFKKLGIKLEDVKAVFLTHCHWDHAGGLCLFSNAEVYIGRQVDALKLKKWLAPQQAVIKMKEGEIKLANIAVKVVESPGHTADSVSYLVNNNLLFTGDSIQLKNFRVKPFPFLLNQESGVLEKTINKLANITGVEYLLTSHSGLSSSHEDAFGQWRETSDGRLT